MGNVELAEAIGDALEEHPKLHYAMALEESHIPFRPKKPAFFSGAFCDVFNAYHVGGTVNSFAHFCLAVGTATPLEATRSDSGATPIRCRRRISGGRSPASRPISRRETCRRRGSFV